MRVTDITGRIYSGMWSVCDEYPGAEISELPQPAFLNGRYSVFCRKFVIGGQTGTYIETRAHVDRSAPPLSAHSAEEFFFDCRIIRLDRKKPLEKISLEEVEARSPKIERGAAVLLNAGWDERWVDRDFVAASPYISKEAGLWLIQKGIRLLGSDFPRFDNPARPEFPWEVFWEKVPFLMAPVVNLSEVSNDIVRLVALPLKIEGAEAAPARAVVIEDSPPNPVDRT